MALPNQFGKKNTIADAESHLKKMDTFIKSSGIDNMLKIREMMIEEGKGNLLPSGGKSYKPKAAQPKKVETKPGKNFSFSKFKLY